MAKYFLSTVFKLLSAISCSCRCDIRAPEAFVSSDGTRKRGIKSEFEGRPFCPG